LTRYTKRFLPILSDSMVDLIPRRIYYRTTKHAHHRPRAVDSLQVSRDTPRFHRCPTSLPRTCKKRPLFQVLLRMVHRIIAKRKIRAANDSFISLPIQCPLTKCCTDRGARSLLRAQEKSVMGIWSRFHRLIGRNVMRNSW
jgi:hypothetical protein